LTVASKLRLHGVHVLTPEEEAEPTKDLRALGLHVRLAHGKKYSVQRRPVREILSAEKTPGREICRVEFEILEYEP
jgi:hypothetical protein